MTLLFHHACREEEEEDDHGYEINDGGQIENARNELLKAREERQPCDQRGEEIFEKLAADEENDHRRQKGQNR